MAFSFNGSSQWLSTASIPGSVGNDARTIAFWLRATANNVRQFPFSEGDESATYSRLAIEFGDGGQAFSLNIRSVAYTGSTVPTVDVWYHLVITFGFGVLRLYVNGVQEVSQAGVTLSTAGSNFNFGRYYGGALYFGGRQAELAKWNVELSAAVVTALAKGLSPIVVRNDSLAFYAPICRDLQDIRGGLAITNNGTATVVDHPRVYAGQPLFA